MVSERTRALLIFVSVVLVGSVAAVALISNIRERMWQRQGDTLEAFLKDLPEKDASQSFVGAPALVFELEDELTYVEEAPEEAKVSIVTRTVPETGILRRALEKWPYRFFRTARGSFVTRLEGVIFVGGKSFVVKSLTLDGGTPKADLWSTGPNARKVGTLELQVTDEKIVQGTIQLDQTGQRYDVIIARSHPNVTGLFHTISTSRPLTRQDVMAVVKTFNENLTHVEPRQGPP